MVDDKHCTLIVFRVHFKVEDAIEGWGSVDVKVGATVAHGVGRVLGTFYPQILEILELADKIKDLLVVSPRVF